MGNASSSLPLVDGFGKIGGVPVDRSSRLDMPWKMKLAEIGETDLEWLENMVKACSDEELHCCRAFFRAFRALSENEMSEEEMELNRQMYFVVAQNSKTLLVFYSILHRCALLGIDSLEPVPEAASVFVQTALDSYAAEKNFETVDLEKSSVEAMRGIVCAYVEELLDLLTNSALAEPCVKVVDGVNVYSLSAPDGIVEAVVSARGGSLLSVTVWGEQVVASNDNADSDVFRCAASPENSSLCNQVFYCDEQSARVEFVVQEESVLLIRQTSLACSPCSFLLSSEREFDFVGESQSSSLVELGKLDGVAEIRAANARVVVKGKQVTIEGTNNWLVEWKFVVK